MSVSTATPSTQDSPRAVAAPAPAEVSPHRRPRASALASMSLLLAAAATFLVLSGVLAAPGAALGLAAAVFGMSGIVAARKRHVTGTANATFGLLLGLAALAVGGLAVSGQLPWLDPDVNQFTRLTNWIDAHAPWATPEM